MKFKRYTVAFAAFLAFICFFGLITAHASSGGLALTIDAKSAVLMEAETGKVLFQQNPDERLAPASVTKVMTILLIYEAIAENRIGWDDVVTVSEHAAGMGGSQIFLEPMERQTVRDLVKAVVIASANDAAVAMAEFISGSEESFVDLMNRKAAELGMKDTQFKNACGLDADGHFMSANDIAILTRELIGKFPEVFEYSTTWMDSITHKTARGEEEFGLTNTNRLIKWYEGATGMKTGSTGKALYCLSGTATRENLTLISVVMAAPAPNVRFQEVMKMFDYGFANYKLAAGDEPGKIMGVVKVLKGDAEEVPVKIKNRVAAVIPKGSSETLAPKIELRDSADAPIQAEQKLGEVIYEYNGNEIGRSDIVATVEIKKASFGNMVKRLSKEWFR